MKKKLIILFTVCALAVFLTACSDRDNDNNPELVIPPDATQTADVTNGIGGFDAVIQSPTPAATP